MKKKLFSSAMLLATAIIWGFAFVAQVQGMEHVGTFTFNGVRFLIGAVVMLPAFLIFTKKKTTPDSRKRSALNGAIAGIILFTAATMQQYAIQYSPDKNSMKAGFITGLYTILVPVAGLIFLKKKAGITAWMGAGVAVVGLYLLCAAGQAKLDMTDILLFISVPVWTTHILFIDTRKPDTDVFLFSCAQYAVCGILSLTGAILFDRASLNAASIGSAMAPILYGGLLSVGVAYTLQFIGQKNADPTAASIILSTESMFGAIGNLLILHVEMSVTQYVGCALIFAGIILAQITVKSKKQKLKNT